MFLLPIRAIIWERVARSTMSDILATAIVQWLGSVIEPCVQGRVGSRPRTALLGVSVDCFPTRRLIGTEPAMLAQCTTRYFEWSRQQSLSWPTASLALRFRLLGAIHDEVCPNC